MGINGSSLVISVCYKSIKVTFTLTISFLYSLNFLINLKMDPYKFLQMIFTSLFHSLQVIAIMVGLCYLGTVQQTQVGIQSVQGVFFMLITENFFTPMYSVMNQLPTQLPLFRREYTSGLYDASTFYIANILSFVSMLSTNRFIIGTLIEQITCGDDNITMCYLYILINILCIIIITFFF